MRLLLAAVTGTSLVASVPSGTHSAAKCDKHLAEYPVPIDSIVALAKTIAVSPLFVAPAMSDSARRRGRGEIDPVVESELQHAGFTVLPAATVDSLYRQVYDSMGGVFDPRTGERDTVKIAAGRVAFLHRLQTRADAVLHLHVGLVTADFEDWTAEWDGVKQSWGNFGHRFLGGMTHGTYKGTTNAMTLFVILETSAGRRLYDGHAGLQVYVIPDNGKFVPVPDSAFFADTARTSRAVRMSLCPLLNHGRS